jgi:transposase
MSQTASGSKDSRRVKLFLALELGLDVWKLAFSTGLDQRIWGVSVPARDRQRFLRVLDRARKKYGLPEGCEVVSCYEAGRDGFWVDRWLRSLGINNVVVDSSSIEVPRRSRRSKTDRLDAHKLVLMLIRYELGDRRVWGVVRVPTQTQEDARHEHRELRTLKKEQTRLINRIKGLLASQGVDGVMGRSGLLKPLEAVKTWDGSSLPEGLRQRLELEIERHAFVHRQVLSCDARIKRAICESSETAVADVRRLAGLRAIGRNGATILVREFGWRDFRNRREVGALAGLTPTPFQSGKSFREGGISRAGNRHVRGIIVDLAWSWLRRQPGSELSCWYRRRFAAGSSRVRRIGIVALARKLLIALWRYWAEGRMPQGAVLKSYVG